ncbi:MAG: hypothetical protein JXA33_19745 [Anaerolineae bacterium]|nr:hypothetical protein [Anaerolineae bacterium]
MPVIVNTTLLSNFASIGQLDVLPKLWQRVFMPDQVYAEIQNGIYHGYVFYEGIEQHIYPFTSSGWLHLTALRSTEEFLLFGELLNELHEGEAACLSIAHHRHWSFISDDRAARIAATRLQVPVSGTLGVLLALVNTEHLSLAQADALLGQMMRGGYYSPVASLNEILP